MKRKAFNDPGHTHYLTFTCYRRQQLLTDDQTRTLLVQAIDKARAMYNFALWAWIIMPEHVHLLLHPRVEDYSISRILQAIKGRSARRIIAVWRESSPHLLHRIRAIEKDRTSFRLWQAGGGFDRNLYQMALVKEKIEYIEYNPVRRRLVSAPDDWRWSSAQARAGSKDVPIVIDKVSFDHEHINQRAYDYRYSLFHDYRKQGYYADDWGAGRPMAFDGEFGE